MLARLRRIREFHRTLIFIGLIVAAVMVAKLWPEVAYWVWGFCLGATALLVFLDHRDPVNYDSLQITDGILHYSAAGQNHLIPLVEVIKLEFVREVADFPDLGGACIESKWIVHVANQSPIEVMDEWPHRKQLLQAYKTYLPHFDAHAAQQGRNARSEGRWLCYEATAEVLIVARE